MSLGFDREPKIVNKNDTADLTVFLYNNDDQPFAFEDLTDVSFAIEKPDNSTVTQAGVVEEDGSGTVLFNSTDLVGHYIAVATFTLTDGRVKSVRGDFEVIDPFYPGIPSQSYVVAEGAWAKLEDCFDAEEDGPWLRDMTLRWFNKDKMTQFIDEALFFINQANPPTTLTVADFVGQDSLGEPVITADLPLLTQGTFLMVVRHLIRSYVEQPQPTGAQIAWQDRRDYLQRWQSVLQIEQAAFDRMLALYKRRFLLLGHTKILVSSKAGRLIAAPMRTRMVGRGYW